MPYEIEERKGKWHVVNKATGEDKGGPDTRERAVAYMRLLNGVEHGWKPTDKERH